MRKEEKLKPCPFCGREVVLDGGEDNELIGEPYYYVFCGKCGCSQYGRTTKEAVAEAWNRRFEE